MIDNWSRDGWYYCIYDWENYRSIDLIGPYNLHIIITGNFIEFKDPGCRYNSFFAMDKKYRIEWRKYYYKIISLLGGNFVIYLPDQGEVSTNFTEKIWDFNIDLNIITKGLVEKYGNNNINIDDFQFDENDNIESPEYFIDYFEDIKNNNK